MHQIQLLGNLQNSPDFLAGGEGARTPPLAHSILIIFQAKLLALYAGDAPDVDAVRVNAYCDCARDADN